MQATILLTSLILLGTLGFLRFWQHRATRATRGAGSRSPFPWLSDDIWSGLERQEGPFLPPRRDARGTIVSPQLTLATDADRARIPKHPLVQDLPVPPESTGTEHREQLIQTKAIGQLRMPVWPVCCNRLSTLINFQGIGRPLADIESEAGPLDQAFLERELRGWGGPTADNQEILATGWRDVLADIRNGNHDYQGMAFYQCRACGRYYVASCQP